MKPRKDFSTAPLAVIGVDIGKEVFHIVGLGVDGKIAFRKKVRRFGFEDAFEKLPPSIVGMEACLSAHWLHDPEIRAAFPENVGAFGAGLAGSDRADKRWPFTPGTSFQNGPFPGMHVD